MGRPRLVGDESPGLSRRFSSVPEARHRFALEVRDSPRPRWRMSVREEPPRGSNLVFSTIAPRRGLWTVRETVVKKAGWSADAEVD